MNKFWLVWSPTSTMPPQTKYGTRGSAEREAEAQARCSGRAEFYVLEALSVSQRPPDIITRELVDDSSEIAY